MTAAPREPSGTLLVPELMARVRQIHIRTHRLVNTALSGGYRSTFRGQGIEFEEVRPYQPGDDVRAIDWNVTARTGEAFIKTFREERELTLELLVDTGLPMDFGSRTWTKREAAAQIAALISFVAIEHQDRVGLTLFGAEPGLHIQARKGPGHVLRVVREVMAAPVSEARSNLEEVLSHEERTLRRRSIVFLISDFVSAVPRQRGAEQDWTDSLARLARRHDVIAVRIVDPFEEALPEAGVLQLDELGGRRRLEVDTRSAAVRDDWSRRAMERREHLRAVFDRARVDWIDLRLDHDLADPIVQFFRRRALRHGGRG